ncbi:DUF1559 domain-containing protein [Planctomycetes bacterium K23_9]|uniref:DUF1559 domain-containing protein n=1 Tax=Stieleria marina TaxID=1930275 RepID=A0A517P3B7_9BACT|nr:hypothetical protein K239x_58850 [Planctomycetes bacterium K23_9]
MITKRLGCLALVVCVGFVIALMLPAVEAARESARRMSCSNHFKNIGLAIHNYHAAYKLIPPGCGGTGLTPGHDDWSNQRRLSALVAITPFVEASPMWSMISNPFVTGQIPKPELQKQWGMKGSPDYRYSLNSLTTIDGPFRNANNEYFFPSMGPAPWRAASYPAWQIGMPTYRCPADKLAQPFAQPSARAAASNYVVSYGDAVHEVGYEPGLPLAFRDQVADATTQRGAFIAGKQLRFRDITDGLSETIFMGEVVTYDGTRRAEGAIAQNIPGLRDDPSLCLATVKGGIYKSGIKLRMSPDGKSSRGGNWADGAISWSGFNTILPPNSPSCDTVVDFRLEGVFSASSNHRGGCHVLMGDGAVVFITNDVDVGDPSRPTVYAKDATGETVSHAGVWRAMGTIDTATTDQSFIE